MSTSPEEKLWTVECSQHKLKVEGLSKYKAEQLIAQDSAKPHIPRFAPRMHQ